MIKIKSKYKQTRLDVERKFVKLSKVENYTRPLSPIIKKIRSDLVIGPYTVEEGNNVFSEKLLGSVGFESESNTSKGSDFRHEIGFGYLNNIEYALDFENGAEQNVSREEMLKWVQSKKHFQGLPLEQQKAIAGVVRFKIATAGSDPQPVLKNAWEEMRDDYLEEVVQIIDGIWGGEKFELF